MEPAARKALKEKIIETIAKLEEDVAALKEQTKPISPENAIGRVSRMEAINSKSVAEAALRSANNKLSSLETALSKVDDEKFGICTRCRKPIQPARLMYMPESLRCVNCAGK